jgi:ketosteroid isomerase-like protein
MIPRLAIRMLLVTLAPLSLGCRSEPEPVMPVEPVRTPAPRGAASAVAASATAEPSAIAEPTPVAAADVTAEVGPFLEEWRAAWQAKALETYLGNYAPDFLGDGMDLERWAARKRDVFARAGDLEVGIEDLEVEPAAEGALARFTQIYQSGALSDRGTKTLVLRKVDGRWKILRESFRKR